MTIEAVLAVTYKCNARCKMCHIWQSKPQEELTPQEFANLPSYLKTINISGGEPFLRNDLPEIISRLNKSCHLPRIVISTNGLLPDRIRDMMLKIKNISEKIGVGVSIDGIGKTHEEVRGIIGAYEKALNSIENLKSIGIKDLRIGFTISDINVEDLRNVYDLANKLRVEFTCSIAQNSEHYFMTNNNKFEKIDVLKEHLEYIAREELKRNQPKRWFRTYFLAGTYYYAKGKKRILPCDAGSNFFFMSPNGNIYPCNILNKVMGNIKVSNFHDIWSSENAEKIRKIVSNCSLNCWMICTARTAIKKNIVKIGYWILKNKLRGYFNYENLISE
ncbi:MAG: radical SAM protein [bacterium]